MNNPAPLLIHGIIVDRIDIGIFAINKNMEVVLWNKFMEFNSGIKNTDIISKNIFDFFPDLPKKWFKRKIDNVFVLNNFSFTSWEQRPYLFKFPNRSPITANNNHMRQNCSFMPVKGISDDIDFVCISITDVTESSTYQLQLKELTEKLSEISNIDGLTNIATRRCLDEQLEKEFDRSKRYGEPLSIIHMDIDHFKDINDNHGHLVGDEVLKQVSHQLKDSLRQTDFIGRYGGEEFTAILPSTGAQGAYFLADRLRETIAATPFEVNSLSLDISISLGVTTLENNCHNVIELMNEADIALYQSKDRGRNQVTVFNNEIIIDERNKRSSQH